MTGLKNQGVINSMGWQLNEILPREVLVLQP